MHSQSQPQDHVHIGIWINHTTANKFNRVLLTLPNLWSFVVLASLAILVCQYFISWKWKEEANKQLTDHPCQLTVLDYLPIHNIPVPKCKCCLVAAQLLSSARDRIEKQSNCHQ